MNLIPQGDDPTVEDEEQAVVQKTDLAPISKDDPPSKWKEFLNTIRTFVGMKPLYYADRFAEARVQEIEIENQIKLIQAKGDYELKMAEAAKKRAEAKKIESEIPQPTTSEDPQIATLLKDHTIEEAWGMVQDLMNEIQLRRGSVEIVPPNLIEGPDEETDS